MIAHATSPDLETWTLGPPLCEPGPGFGQLEVLQNKEIDGRWVLVFTCHPQEMTAERIAAHRRLLHLVGARSRTARARGTSTPRDRSRSEPHLFAAPLVQQRDGSWVLIGFRNLEPQGLDGFEITDPIPVTLDADGYLVAR